MRCTRWETRALVDKMFPTHTHAAKSAVVHIVRDAKSDTELTFAPDMLALGCVLGACVTAGISGATGAPTTSRPGVTPWGTTTLMTPCAVLT